MHYVTASLRPQNDQSGVDTDIFGPWNAFFGFYGAPEQRSSLISQLTSIN